MSNSVDEIREQAQTARDALEFVKQYNMASYTHPSFGGLTPERQKQVAFSINQARAASRDTLVSENIDKLVVAFDQVVNQAKQNNSGNCVEQACVALDYIARHKPNDRAEVFAFPQEIDHVICVVNRDPNSTPEDPATWGDKAFICDPWGETDVYPASQLAQQNKEFKFNQTSYDSETDTLNNKQTTANYDPNQHKMMLSPYTTDNIKEARNAIVKRRQDKIDRDLSALDTLSKGIEENTNRLKTNKQTPISAKKLAILEEKGKEIREVRKEIENNLPTADNYTEIRDSLEHKLQKATSLTDTQQDTLNLRQHKMWDAYIEFTTGRPTQTTTAKSINQSIEKSQAIRDGSKPVPSSPEAIARGALESMPDGYSKSPPRDEPQTGEAKEAEKSPTIGPK